MSKIRTEAFQRIIAEEIGGIPEGGGIIASMSSDCVSRLPVIAEDEARKAALVEELESISREYEDLYQRRRKAIRTLKRLSVGKVLMTNPLALK